MEELISKHICHSCFKEIKKEQCNICDQCWELDNFCFCPECEEFRG